jgi:hypothetical protein
VKLSVIGLETTHGFIYPAMFNGYDPAALERNALDIVWNIFPTGGARSIATEGVEIVACYDPDPELGRKVAEACRIERVCTELAAAYRDVDGVIITAGDATTHLALAEPALRAGLPVFVDKPFAATTADATAMAELASQHGAPLFCTSAIRFADQTRELRERFASAIGEPLTAHVIGTGDYASYAVHSLEFLLSAWGGGVRALRSLGQEGFDVVQIEFSDGRQAIWQNCKPLVWMFHLALYGSEGYDEATITFEDRYRLFRNTAEEIARFMVSGESPVPIEDTLEIVRILELVPAARGDGQTHMLA